MVVYKLLNSYKKSRNDINNVKDLFNLATEEKDDQIKKINRQSVGKIVEKIVEKEVIKVVTEIVEVEKIIEKPVEVERIVYVDKIVEKDVDNRLLSKL